MARHVEGDSTPQYKKNILWTWPSEALFLSYGLMQIKGIPWSLHPESRDGVLHNYTVTAWLNGKFKLSY